MRTSTNTKSTGTKSAAAKKARKTKSSARRKASAVELGEKIPDFTVMSTSGRAFSSSDLIGKTTVLYFYPKDSTPGCTLEGHDFKARFSSFKKLNTQILGVSRDSITSHEKFKSKCGFPFELLSDGDEKLSRLFGVIQLKKLYGREFEGIERSTFVIDKTGRLRREWRRVKVEGHAAEVLLFIETELKA